MFRSTHQILLILLLSSFIQSCSSPYIPQTGDLVFQDLDCGDLCNAIEKVTEGVDGTNLSHVGIISVENDTTFVYEAIGQGVMKTVWTKFMERSKDSAGKPKILAGRLKKEHRSTIPSAINMCRELLHQPYDDVFYLENQRYYCSELVYFAFRDSTGKYLFELKPMTFKDPETDKTFPAWEEYFNELHEPIPEGMPGLNPGGISRSARLNIIYKFY